MARTTANQPSTTSSQVNKPTSSQNDSQVASQEIDTQTIEAIGKTRRTQRHEAILAAHHARIEKTAAKIEDCFQRHEARKRALRQSKVERLRVLLQQQRALEDKIDACHAAIEQAFMGTERQLKVALDERIEDLSCKKQEAPS